GVDGTGRDGGCGVVPAGDRPRGARPRGHYVMTVKENHPTLRATIELLLNSEVTKRVTVRRGGGEEIGHGRIERGAGSGKPGGADLQRGAFGADGVRGTGADLPHPTGANPQEDGRARRGSGARDQRPDGEAGGAQAVVGIQPRPLGDRKPVAPRAGRDL